MEMKIREQQIKNLEKVAKRINVKIEDLDYEWENGYYEALKRVVKIFKDEDELYDVLDEFDFSLNEEEEFVYALRRLNKGK